jgi:hypothetical protein
MAKKPSENESEDSIAAAKRIMARMVQMPPKPHEKMRIGKARRVLKGKRIALRKGEKDA